MVVMQKTCIRLLGWAGDFKGLTSWRVVANHGDGGSTFYKCCGVCLCALFN